MAPIRSIDEEIFFFCFHKVYVGIISALITIPVNLILIGLFKTILPSSNSNLSSAMESSTASLSSAHENQGTEEGNLEESYDNDAFDSNELDAHSQTGLVTGIFSNETKSYFYFYLIALLMLFGIFVYHGVC